MYLPSLTKDATKINGLIIYFQRCSGSVDSTVRLSEVNWTGLGSDFDGLSDPVASVAYSPDGQVVISGDRDGSVRQYVGATGKLGFDFPTQSSPVRCVQCSPNGLLFASTGNGNDAMIWSTVSRAIDVVLRGHTGPVNGLAFSPCNSRIVTCSDDKTIRRWRVRSGTELLVLTGHTDLVTSVAFSPTGLQNLSASLEGSIRVWETGDELVAVLYQGTAIVTALVYSPTSNMLATSCHINVDIQLWNARSKKPSNSNIYPLCILRHHNIVNCFAFSSSGQWIVANCVSAVWIWKRKGYVLYMDKWRDWECIDIVRGIIGIVNSIVWRLSTLEFITGSKD